MNPAGTEISYISAPDSQDDRLPSTAPPAGALIKGNAAQTGYDASLILPDPVVGNENQLLSLNADRTSIAYIDAPSSNDSKASYSKFHDFRLWQDTHSRYNRDRVPFSSDYFA